MRFFRALLALSLCAALLAFSLSGCGQKNESITDAAPTIALLPLDSRPASTQYPALVAQISALTLALPPETAADSFLTPSDTDALWDWLENEAMSADHVIIFINNLFCGGLIASRSSGAYDNAEEDLARLEDFCKRYSADDAHTLTVVQVLPRLLPNQFDERLALYDQALAAYGQTWDEANANGQAAPESAEGIPAEALAEYRALHEKSAELALGLDALAKEGLIDQLLISQDDGAEYCPANITFRALSDHAETTTLLYGADELAMLLVAGSAAEGLDATPVALHYSSEESKDTVYPYETVALKEMVAQKLALASLTEDEEAPSIFYIHCQTDDADDTLSAIDTATGVFALADVALTNQADPALKDALLAPENADALSAYAGWNTAGNTVGTAAAMLRSIAVLDSRWDSLSESAQENAISALFCMKAVRLGEDVGYMAGFRSEFLDTLENSGLTNYTSAFTDEAAQNEATAQLETAYAPYDAALARQFNGQHTINLGAHKVTAEIADFHSQIRFPWPRAFEVEIEPSFSLTLQ